MSGSNEKLRVLRRIPEIRFDEELRGYNKHQVDRVLENLAPLADEVDVLVDRLSEAERRAAAAEARVMESGGPAPSPLPPAEPVAPVVTQVTAQNFDETLSKTLLLAQRTADATVQEANENAAQIVAEAEAEAAATRQAVEQEAASLRAAAEDERLASIEQANREVAAMIDAARTTIDAKVAEAEAELAQSHAATRDDLIEQIGSLQRSRDALALDVEHFEGHLSSRREVIRGALADLSAVVDDPERLRTVMPPTPLADLPDLGSAEPAQIDVASLDTLATAVAADAAAQGVLAPDLRITSSTSATLGTWADETDTWADVSSRTESEPDALPYEVPSIEGDATVDGHGDESEHPIDEALSSGVLVDPVSLDDSSVDDSSVDDTSFDDSSFDDSSFDDSSFDDSSFDGAVAGEEPFELPIRSANESEAANLDEPTQAMPIVDPSDPDPSRSERMDAPLEATSDPFLDELRRATSEDDDDEALSKFLNDADTDDDNKGGWFGRRK